MKSEQDAKIRCKASRRIARETGLDTVIHIGVSNNFFPVMVDKTGQWIRSESQRDKTSQLSSANVGWDLEM